MPALITLIWIPIVISFPNFFLRRSRINEDSFLSIYSNYSSEILVGIIISFLFFSLTYSIREIGNRPSERINLMNYIPITLVLLTIPIHYLFYLAAHVAAFGK